MSSSHPSDLLHATAATHSTEYSRLLGTNILMWSLMLIIVSLRLVARHLSKATLWYDDWLILPAIVCQSLLHSLIMHLPRQKRIFKLKRLVSFLPRRALPQLSGVSDQATSVSQIVNSPSSHVRLRNSDTEWARSERRHPDTRSARHTLEGHTCWGDWLGEHRLRRQVFHSSLLLASI